MTNARASGPADPSAAALDWTELRRDDLARVFKKHVQGEVRFDPATRALYSTDASVYQIEPVGVIVPHTRADVVAAVQIAMEQRVPVIPRGGGTSLSGQSIGRGIILDFRKRLNRILETNAEEKWARVEPGVVLAQFNRHLQPLALQFGPDVATIDRANLGGMIGNNSAGARSIKYGKTIDHVLALDVVLTDGKCATFAPIAGDPLDRLLTQPDREGEIHRTVRDVIFRHQTEIGLRFPKILRRVSGYNLDALLPPAPLNLAKLIVGSEGTLATVLEAKLNLVHRPARRGIAVLHFAELQPALRALAPILQTDPTAVELIDEMILELARGNPEYRGRIDFLIGEPAAILVVEYASDDPAEIPRRFNQLREAVAGCRVVDVLTTEDPDRCEHIWSVRKTAMPLLMSLSGERKPITFVEDTAVDPLRLPEFVARFKEILHRHGTDGSFYGHASVGCLHIRPLVNLRTPAGVETMNAIAEAVVDLVLEFGGALSGEHGDGLLRSWFNPKLFGPEVYGAFRRVKRAFDPENLMNPGKIVDAPPIAADLRDAGLPEVDIPTRYSYEREGGMVEVVRNCNGNALCRREDVGVMCPSYMATRAEEHSPRGRANLLRHALEGRLEGTADGDWASPLLGPALDLCLSCKACKTECPSHVDIAKLKAEYLNQLNRRRRPPMLTRLVADLRGGFKLGSRFAPFSNWALRSWPGRWLLEKFVGIDARRKLPALHRQTLEVWFSRHKSECRKSRGSVVLLADCFTNFNEPAVGTSAVRLLERAGYQVHLAPICCGRAMISKGLLDLAGDMIRDNLRRLEPFVEDGVPILGTEPSCILTLADEWRDLVPGELSAGVAGLVGMVDHFLAERQAAGAGDLTLPEAGWAGLPVVLHGHCHQKAARKLAGTVAALESLAGVDAEVLDAGCCGMAGSFGYERGHYEVSVAIAHQRLLPALRRAPEATVLAPGFSCRHQIADLARRRALHPIEFIAQRIL